jgi:hypothetical protein
MTRSLLASLFLCSVLALLPENAFPQSNQNEPPLTNAAIVKLTKAGFKEKTIISIISARTPRFDLSTERMIELKRNGVSEKIIVAMLARQEGMEMDLSDESWADDLFSDKGDKKSAATGGNSDNSGTEIFGSSGGVKGRTRSRGATGGIDQDVQTTGSATVRILRPPTEAGGGSAKLEKAQTLTNDSIIELVEAGFSEGTILRRIEQSSVGFDLSTAKLEDLRKHRVSDKILAAMKAAMGDDSNR